MKPECLARLRTILPEDAVTTEHDALQSYGLDWTKHYSPAPSAVAFPTTTEQVRQLVLWARESKTALVPSGGRTGLSGAAAALKGEVVVSFDRMNKILDFNAVDRTVTCQAGVVTETLQKHARENGYYYPVDFAARGSSQIGGNIATNAGGIKVIRYGSTREWVSGLQVVTGRGEVLELNRGLIKNATGLDFRHLFIGSEGTLGFITEATMKVTSPPADTTVLVLGVTSLETVMNVFRLFRDRLSLTAFEFFSDLALKHVLRQGRLAKPFAAETPFYVVTEVEVAGETELEALSSTFEECVEKGWIADGVISQSETQARDFWGLREDISESLARHMPYKNDISVRISQVPPFLHEVDGLLAKSYPDFEVVWFGHIGDGNLHINVLKPENLDKRIFLDKCRDVNALLFREVEKFGGSVSAEHGVGLVKKPFLHHSRGAEEIQIMREVKKIFDPDGIMNPGKIFD